MLLNIITIFLFGMLELWVSIPIGFALQVHPVLICIIAFTGCFWCSLMVVVIGEKARTVLMRIHGKKYLNRSGKIWNLWENYGVQGLGFVAPLLMGPIFGTILGLVLKCDILKLLLWMGIGILFWSIVITTVVWFGIIQFN